LICAGPPDPTCRIRGDAKVIPLDANPKSRARDPELLAPPGLVESLRAPIERFSGPETTRAVGGYPNPQDSRVRLAGRSRGPEIGKPDTVRDPRAYKLSRLRPALDLGSCLRHC